MIPLSRWQWELPPAQPAGHVPAPDRWLKLALDLPEELEAVVYEAMRHATDECGYAGTNPFECPHVREAMDAAFSAAEKALPPMKDAS